ncbi:acetylcholine receptor subunit alpha-type acr-16-like [Pollicipes pollicipes]|uniref:acetylcholine receptor subunit alpha-type acr-16-like n=1 Tax=Pollicipes pollicipes TaxID=41117 RepID=UPI0018853A80|nr:acetylcholine receptor subunit alpha-type acr-16-like [Pollicipes pollicipes]
MRDLLALSLLAVVAVSSGLNEELELRQLLLSRPERMVRPVSAYNDSTNIIVGLMTTDVEVDERRNTATVSGWLHIEWESPALAWTDFPAADEVSRTRLPLSEMWSPDLLPYNMVPSAGAEWLRVTPVVIWPGGRVLVVPMVTFTVRCSRTVTDDSDQLSCPIKIGSWTHSVEELDLQPTADTVDVSNMAANGAWKVASSSVVREAKMYDCCPEEYVSLNIELVLRPQRC